MSKVSFTVRRPTPVSRDASSGPESDSNFKIPALPRHLAQDSAPGSPLSRSRTSSPARYHEPDSSDEDDEPQDELVSAFDAMGAQRLHKSKKVPQGPLVIPALKNRDWRELARKRRSASQFVPESAKAVTGKDGSVGGLGTRDTINSGPVLSGLQVKAKVKKEEEDAEVVESQEVEMVDVKGEEEEETEDQRALRAILAAANGELPESVIDIIPTPVSEGDAYKQDVEELPDAATLDDYNRVPIEQFGLALLRGMGWKEGTAASRKPGKGLVQPYLPEARPALLGIGAKEQEVFDDGSNKKGSKRPERRYVPVVKQDREGGSSSGRGESSTGDRPRSPRRENGSATVSRRNSRSRSPGRRDRDRDDRRRESSRRDTDYDDRRRDSSRRDGKYDTHRGGSHSRRDDSDRYGSSSRRRD
ncbi:DExH-box splicing factor binding site-domain-containing protein [Mycena albidolilacea]|uniref:DExH-box splicing factor binding site-domain-containing protein n=1 Tax=Mycena albidolilacea TaxID=1033008 RepID=A0AAD7ETA8_9AGAR|nr:DExH-box splicing factor binding site-domain-containing protein [Mycena albidolilacea]